MTESLTGNMHSHATSGRAEVHVLSVLGMCQVTVTVTVFYFLIPCSVVCYRKQLVGRFFPES